MITDLHVYSNADPRSVRPFWWLVGIGKPPFRTRITNPHCYAGCEITLTDQPDEARPAVLYSNAEVLRFVHADGYFEWYCADDYQRSTKFKIKRTHHGT